MTQSELSSWIVDEAIRLGFSACGLASLQPFEQEATVFDSWLAKGYHADMAYMANHKDKRLLYSELLEGAVSAVVVILNYKQPALLPSSSPQIAQYAYGMDYHFLLKNKLQLLLAKIKEKYSYAEGRAFVDSAPVWEKALARRAGLGWIGKNSLLINPRFGSTTYIGSLLLNITLDYNTKVIEDRCGKCSRCIASCPTSAILADSRQIDANLCISYLNKNSNIEISSDIRQLIGNRLWGCDECIKACPFNQNTPYHTTAELNPLPELFQRDLSSMSRSQLRKIIMRRPK